MSNEVSRKAFEVWAEECGLDISTWTKNPSAYKYDSAIASWAAWQASRKALEADVTFTDEGNKAQQVAVPDKREPLSDDEIAEWFVSENGLEDSRMCIYLDFEAVIRAVENRLGIKAALQGDTQ